MGSQEFCLRWNNYQNNIADMFDELLGDESFVDVTVACEGNVLKAHKLILSACSPFFKTLLKNNPCQHPIIILRDTKFNDLKAILAYMYHGEVNVTQNQLGSLMKTAEVLQIKGLAEANKATDSNFHQPEQISQPAKPYKDLQSYPTNQPKVKSSSFKRKSESQLPPSKHKYTNVHVKPVEVDITDDNLEVVTKEVEHASQNSMTVYPSFPLRSHDEPSSHNSSMIPNMSSNESDNFSIAGDPEMISEFISSDLQPNDDGATSSKYDNDSVPFLDASGSDEYFTPNSDQNWNKDDKGNDSKSGIDKRFAQAVSAVLSGELGFNRASRVYSVPLSTLWRRVKYLQGREKRVQNAPPSREM